MKLEGKIRFIQNETIARMIMQIEPQTALVRVIKYT